MGAEGYICVSRMSKGHELVTPQMPVFKVTEPVALLLCGRSSFAGLPAFNVAGLGLYQYLDGQQVALLTESGQAAVGLYVVLLWEFLRLQERDGGEFVPGAYSDKQRDAWEQIINGTWIVSGYGESGTDWHERIPCPSKGIETDTDVRYKIWT